MSVHECGFADFGSQSDLRLYILLVDGAMWVRRFRLGTRRLPRICLYILLVAGECRFANEGN